ncbi:hypothetical protein FDP41_011347 [Naegleria fowleri]|uniref:RNase H type-1 domain-containing protein n=1 Tax=Naegleria fowleri TaxID=5763 RepID=A0A6A5BYP6_NAEFO|nr:uncharacterized protein FDP41_011347 [Naegleria fowleri]KAF0982417.1 hypothetical protein FDP41_011347 [Naegleria fowleri]
MANHPNNLIRKAYVFGMSHHKDTENNIFHHWKSNLKEYNISVKLNNQQFSLPQLSGTNFEIHTDGSRQNGKSGMGINIYDHSHAPKQLYSHSLRIHDGYSHNIAELASILTSIHLLPNHSKATIHTDNQVAIQALKKNYRGRFLLFYREFQKIIRARNLQISLKKVKGHKDPENIKVDALARQSLSQPTIFDIRQLFGKQRLLTKTGIIIFNQREMTRTFHYKKMTTKLDNNPNLIDHVHQKSLNIRFLKAKISPNYKYGELLSTLILDTSQASIALTEKSSPISTTTYMNVQSLTL